MGYYLYRRAADGNGIRLDYERQICLAGCNQGIVPKKVLSRAPSNNDIPFAWTWELAKEYNGRKEAVLIDIKPNKDEFFYCELDAVFGVCYEEWTPIMYRLRRLFPYEPRGRDENTIFYDGVGHEIIYTTSYMLGTIVDGKLEGRWTAPNQSSANGTLLWPEAATHFFNAIRNRDITFIESPLEEINL